MGITVGSSEMMRVVGLVFWRMVRKDKSIGATLTASLLVNGLLRLMVKTFLMVSEPFRVALSPGVMPWQGEGITKSGFPGGKTVPPPEGMEKSIMVNGGCSTKSYIGNLHVQRHYMWKLMRSSIRPHLIEQSYIHNSNHYLLLGPVPHGWNGKIASLQGMSITFPDLIPLYFSALAQFP